jgi:hypothetical protein
LPLCAKTVKSLAVPFPVVAPFCFWGSIHFLPNFDRSSWILLRNRIIAIESSKASSGGLAVLAIVSKASFSISEKLPS